MAASEKDYSIPVPAPNQNQIVKLMLKGVTGDSISPYIIPGHTKGGIANLFRIRKLDVYLIASAAVANRSIRVSLATKNENNDPAAVIIGLDSGIITASQTGKLTLLPMGTLLTCAPFGYNVMCYAEIGNNLTFSGWDYVQVLIYNGQAGDVMNVYGEYEYLNHRLGITEK